MKSFLNKSSLKLVAGFLAIIFLGIATLALINSQKPSENIAAPINK